MHISDLETIAHRQPSRPFRMTLSTQEVFDVTHPELVFFSKHFVAVGVKRTETEAGSSVLMYWIDTNHIVHVRQL